MTPKFNFEMRYKAQFLLMFLNLMVFIFPFSGNSQATFTKKPVIVENPNRSAPLSYFVDFETSAPYETVSLNVSTVGREFQLEYSVEEKSDLGYLIFLLQPGTENNIRLSITDSKGRKNEIGEPLVITAPHLPEGALEFPKIEITSVNERAKEELILFNPRRRVPIDMPNANKFNTSFGMLAIANKKGDVLWYYRTDSRISDFDFLPNGNLSYMTQDSRICEIDFSGNMIRQWYAAKRPEGRMEDAIPVDALTFHHDVSMLPNGNRLVCSTEIKEIDDYYTSERDKNAPRKRQKVMGDVILEFTPKGDIVHRWSSFDELPTMRIGYETFSNYWVRRGFPGVIDWSHANAVVPLPHEDAYLVNFRYQSAMIKVNKKKGKIEWIFAEPSGWGRKLQHKLLKIPEDDWNWHQHSPKFTKNGNLLFFNNNNYKARPFDEVASLLESPSHVVEYKIDETDLSVEKIWDSRNKNIPPVISIAMGRVSELPETGNILACYGALLSPEYFDQMTWWNRGRFPQWTMVREHTRTMPSEIVWEMKILSRTPESKVGWTLFGAERIEIPNVVR